MTGPEHGNAMTEIALALAMAFFALMILTMVSMGAGDGAATPAPLQLGATADSAGNADSTAAAEPVDPDALVIFADGRYYDARLQPLDIPGLSGRGTIVLAVPPQLSLATVMQAKARLPVPEVTVVPLDDDWQAAVAGARQ